MRRSRYAYTLILLLIAIMTLSLAGCGVWVREYPLAGTSYEYELDDSIPLVDMDNIPVDNMSRGFRGEAYLHLGMNEAYPGKGDEPRQYLIDNVARYADDDARLVQVYVYIDKYYNTNIDEAGFIELKDYLELVRSLGVKVLLRFAYETGNSKDGPRTSDIERHAMQIGKFMDANIDLVNSTIYAMQMGMIGLWGEGHGAHHRIDVARVARAVADMTPEGIPLMVRTPEMLRRVPEEYEHRFGVHDDFLVGYDHEWGMMDWHDDNYQPLLNKCKYTVTDAEMPWGSAGHRIDMMGVIRQCVGYGLTSLSIEHNYKENGESYALKTWQSQYLDKHTLDEEHFPYNPALLVDGKISVYDYLKHHLGYQIVASNLIIEHGNATFMLTNFGMALPYGYELHVYVNGVEQSLTKPFDARELIAFGQHTYTIPYAGGTIELALVNSRDTTDTIHLFNAVPYTAGKNKIYEG